MPELPDVEAYLSAMAPRIKGRRLDRVRIVSPFVVRTVDPAFESLAGTEVSELRRVGKRIVIRFNGELFVVIHLMIAGRLRWAERGAKPPAKIGLASFDFSSGTLHLTEAGTKRRASIHVVSGEAELAKHDPGGIEPLTASPEEFAAVLRRENHTLKRSLTDPRLFAGIGNAYSDEILHAARLSPIKWTSKLTDEEIARLCEAARTVLLRWTAELSKQFIARFPGPGEVTAFRDGFAAHGRFNKPCPDCATPIQRIRYAENETNYCPMCQTEGKVLADRSLSRLLREDWPRTVEELESRG